MPKKLRGCLIALVMVIVGVVVLYNGARWGYYQGWWGKQNPIARYLWLCDAPPGFEQTLYPDNVEILVPACENLGSKTSHRSIYSTSDKRYLRVGNPGGLETVYWIEIATGQVTARPSNVQYLAARRREEGEWTTLWFSLDSSEVITGDPGGVVLEECGMNYTQREGLLSEDKRRVAKKNGIYDALSGERLLPYGIGDYAPTGYSYHQSIHDFYPCAWLPDNQALILIPPTVAWGLELLIWGDYGEFTPESTHIVPQPVLKFTVPEAYR